MAAARWTPVIGLLLLLPLLPSASSSALVLKLEGSVYPAGHYYVTMNVGEKAKPYFFDIDTGSKLTWLECDAGHGSSETCNKVPHGLYPATQSKFVPCASPMCDAMHDDLGATKDCKNGPQRCDYRTGYKDGSHSIGVLVTDKFTFRMANGHDTTSEMAFGCGYNQVKRGHQKIVAVDGLLGLGRGSGDFVSQLKNRGLITKNMISHCLSTKGGGYLIFGESDLPPKHTKITWVPMAPALPGESDNYSPGQATLQLDTKSVDAKPVRVVFDSGSTYTYMPEKLHTALIHALARSLRRKTVRDPALPLCWSRPGGFKSIDDLRNEFKSVMSLKFQNGATMMIPPENYLTIITETGNACLGVLSMEDLDKIIIGDVTLQDQLVIYDKEEGKLGWMRFSCVPSKQEYL